MAAALLLGVLLGLLLGRLLAKQRRVAAGSPGPRRLEAPPEQLRRWIQEAPQGWLLISPDGRIASLNPRLEQLLALEAAHGLLGEPVQLLQPPQEVMHLIELARDKGLPQRGNWPLKGRDAGLELRLLPGSNGWVAVLLEGRNPLEAQLEQQEHWVSDVAHELRTPITALMLVGDSLAASAEGRQAVLVGRLQKELERLKLLVSDLLDLSRLENTPMALANSYSAIDPRDVIGSVWSNLEPLAQERGVQLQVRPGREQRRLTAVDPARLHQALLNLLDNALRYAPNESWIELDILERDRWCLLSVRDHGPGLTDNDQERLFQRFYRGDPSRAKGPRTGSGLGLAIVKQIALSQGGTVRARNHPEGGAVLELLLPRA